MTSKKHLRQVPRCEDYVALLSRHEWYLQWLYPNPVSHENLDYLTSR